MASKKKLATSVAAVATAAALLLGGTFAWQSVNQTALNEGADTVNPGGRLHNDMWYVSAEENNNDIYVENFADDEIFARVKLSEYMEIVMNYDPDDPDAEQTKVETIAGSKTLNDAVVTDKATDNTSGYKYEYVTHYFDQTNVTEEYWDWTMGAADSAEVYYMPTFNMNKDSFVADRNGMYVDRIGGISNRKAAQYKDYTVWADGDTQNGTEIYDVDSNQNDEVKYDFENLQTYIDAENIKTVAATHAAKLVGTTNGLISMADWLALNNGTYSEATHANYWVYDTDGWVYWSSPIKGGETTGLLLDGIELNQVMDDTWYYAIEVTGQFVTANDMGSVEGQDGFYAPDNNGVVSAPSEDALTLLEEIGVDVDGADGEGSDEELGYIETLDSIDFSSGVTPQVTVYRGTAYSFGDVTSGGWFPVSLRSAEIITEGATSYVNAENIIVIDANEPKDSLTMNVTYVGDGPDEYTSAVTLIVKSPAMPTDAESLKDALNNGGMINIGGTIETNEAETVSGLSFSYDLLWHAGGTVNGGMLNLTSADSRGLFINNENGWPETGDGASVATMNDTTINAKGVSAVYVQAIDAPVNLNNVKITSNNAGLYVNMGSQPVTLNNVTIEAAKNDTWAGEDYFNSAIAVAKPGYVVINSGSYTGTNAVYIFSSGGTVDIYGGTFDGALTVDAGTLTIYGGTFTVDPSDFVPEGYVVTKNGDETWTVEAFYVEIIAPTEGTKLVKDNRSYALIGSHNGAEDIGRLCWYVGVYDEDWNYTELMSHEFGSTSGDSAYPNMLYHDEQMNFFLALPANFAYDNVEIKFAVKEFLGYDDNNEWIVKTHGETSRAFDVVSEGVSGGGTTDDEETPSWMPKFTKDDTIMCAVFTQYGAVGVDEERATTLYFSGQRSDAYNNADVTNVTLTVYDEFGNKLAYDTIRAGTLDGTIEYLELTKPIEGVQPGDKFYAVATYDLGNVTYGNSWEYTWSDLANHVTFIETVVNEENMFTKSVSAVYLFDKDGKMFDLEGENNYDMVVIPAGQEWLGMSAIADGSMSFVKDVPSLGGVVPFTFGVVTGAQYGENGDMTGYTDLVWQSDVYYLYDDAIHTYVQTVKHNGVKYFAMRAVDDNEICLVTPEKMDKFNCCASYSTGVTSVGDINWDNLTENCEHWFGATPAV